ncbi:hypothetical protein Rruber_05459 (plasmid) [Rhodococcus ruber]|uniref:helix-turn-helix domain-containing protein n=1 Tax=Rhodococcus ruber TaxID=1830 RepID=UPI00315D433C
MLDAAAQLFLDRGYAGTTVVSVAAQSGVSLVTIYKSFGGKTGLVRALHARSLAGRGRILYETLVLRRGWIAEQYGTFIADADTLGATLLPP